MTLRALYIDPGYARDGGGCACARGEDGYLQRVWFERFESSAPRRADYDRVYWERPTFQGARSQSAGHETLILLATEGALLAGAYAACSGAELVTRTPHEWKGSLPKPVHHAKLWDVLNAAERTLLGGAKTERLILAARRKGALARWAKGGAYYYGRGAGSEVHNLLDAVAMLCHDTGRLILPGKDHYETSNQARGKIRRTFRGRR